MTDIPLVATLLPNRGIADIAVRAWEADEAIAPIPADAPKSEIERRLTLLRPTHLVDGSGRHARRDGRPVPADTAAVVTTSGTTGTPKLVELTRSGMEVMGRGYTAAVEADADDCWLACMPLHHVASLAIIARAHVCKLPVVVHDKFDLQRVGASSRDEGVTMVSLVPTILHRLVEIDAPLESFRRLIIGGAVLAPGLRTRAEAAGAVIADAYGLTETWGGCVTNGVPNDGVDARLGTDDEVQIRGGPVMRRYRFADDATRAVLDDDGWFHTGDVGAFVDGRLTIIDRLNDLVITGGVNVSPTEVEDVLLAHPAIRDVCVIGEPDDEWGERVVAVVVATDTPPSLDELRGFGRERLATPKLPRALRFVDEIPRSASGKPLRRLLRDVVAE